MAEPGADRPIRDALTDLCSTVEQSATRETVRLLRELEEAGIKVELQDGLSEKLCVAVVDGKEIADGRTRLHAAVAASRALQQTE
jgi:hypothetical protein